MIVIGVDGGGTTGLGMFAGGRWSALQMPASEVRAWLTGYVTEMHAGHPDERIYIAPERYIVAPGRGARSTQNDALEVNNQIVSMAAIHDPRAAWLTVRQQGAGNAKKLAPNEMLRTLHMYTPGCDHANDATRHMLLCLMTFHPREYLRVLAGDFIDLNTPMEV